MVKSNIYKVSWNKLVSWLIPAVLFKPKMYALLKSLVAPIGTLHTTFLAFRKQKIYELGITSQVCYLEKLLNDKFDISQRRIYISEGVKSKKKYVFKTGEFVPLPVFKSSENRLVPIYKRAEITTTTYHFVVNVPALLSIDIAVLTSVLNIYRLPSRRYKIERF